MQKGIFYLGTNLPAEEFSNAKVVDIYPCRWAIDLLWKFLNMYPKLNNGVTLQIYMILIAYIILQLMEIPKFYGDRLLNKLRYLQ